MNFRSTYVLLGLVIAALGGLAIYILVSGGGDKTPVGGEGFVLRSLKAAGTKADQIDTVELELPGQTPDKIVFSRDKKTWVMTAPAKARVEGATIDSIINGLLNAKTEKNADISTNLAAHGLESPPVKITLRAGNSADTIALGNVTVGGNQAVIYVTTSDNPTKAQAARKSDFQNLFKTDSAKTATHAGQLVKSITEFRSLAMLGDGLVDPVAQVKSLRIIKDKDELALFQSGGVWKFRLPADYGDVATEGDAVPPKDAKEPPVNNVRTLLNLLTAIKAGDIRQIIEQPKALTTYGLDPGKDKPWQIDLVRDDGTQETLYVGVQVPPPAKADAKAEPVDRYYARNAADSVVMEVNATAVRGVERVMKAKHLLRDRTVLRASPELIDAIDVEVNGDKFELRKVQGNWKVYDAAGNERPVRMPAVSELLTRLTAKQLATGFPDPALPEDKRGFAKSTVEIKLWENGIVREEKSDPKAKPKVTAPPTNRLQFGFEDIGGVVFTRRFSGEAKTDYYLPQDAFKLVARSRLEYIDVPMKPFGADAALKLSFTRGKDTYEVERTDDGKPTTQATWKITSPEAIKGRPADSFKIFELLNQLSFMRPAKVVADRPTAEPLNRLEVNPASPRMKVTVKLKDQGNREFYFGGDVGTEKKSVYLKPSDEEVIVEVDRSVFDVFSKADVQDMVVHKIDKAKIKSVKITGWNEVFGMPSELVIERKEGKWTLTKGGMFELDPAKVDLLLNDLTTPKADAFVVYKTGPAAEHRLEAAKNALLVEMDVEEKGVTKMALSDPNKEGKIFATTSALAGDVFTMPDKFALLRQRPAALKKD